MKITRLLLIGMCCVVVVPAVWAQTANRPSKAGILGYLDPHTGAFRPVPLATEDDVEPAALTTFTGTITVTLNITVKSTGLSNFLCTADVFVLDALTTTPRDYVETVGAVASGSGTTRTCKLTLPYAWGLLTQSSDSMTTSYFVTATGTTVGTERSSGLSPLDTRKVPASGATTALTAAVTI